MISTSEAIMDIGSVYLEKRGYDNLDSRAHLVSVKPLDLQLPIW